MAGPENQVLVFALAIQVGFILSNFFNAITHELVLPFISPVKDGAPGLIVQIVGVKINIGEVIAQTLNLLISFMVIYIALPYVKEYVPVAGRR